MKIIATLGEILDAPVLGSWDKFCEKRGWHVWILNEGQADKNETAELDIEEAQEYGLIKKT